MEFFTKMASDSTQRKFWTFAPSRTTITTAGVEIEGFFFYCVFGRHKDPELSKEGEILHTQLPLSGKPVTMFLPHTAFDLILGKSKRAESLSALDVKEVFTTVFNLPFLEEVPKPPENLRAMSGIPPSKRSEYLNQLKDDNHA